MFDHAAPFRFGFGPHVGLAHRRATGAHKDGTRLPGEVFPMQEVLAQVLAGLVEVAKFLSQ